MFRDAAASFHTRRHLTGWPVGSARLGFCLCSLQSSYSDVIHFVCNLPAAGLHPHNHALLYNCGHAVDAPHLLQNGVSHQQSVQLQQPGADESSGIPSQALQNMQFGPLDFSSGVHPAQSSHVGLPAMHAGTTDHDQASCYSLLHTKACTSIDGVHCGKVAFMDGLPPSVHLCKNLPWIQNAV